MHLLDLAADGDSNRAEVDLQLVPRRRLEADRGNTLRLDLLAQVRSGALHGPQTDIANPSSRFKPA